MPLEHFTDDDEFWLCYHKLPQRIRNAADRQYAKLRVDPSYPSLHFYKRCDTSEGQIWGARVNREYRALAVRVEPNTYRWFWIGHHEEYDRILDLLC